MLSRSRLFLAVGLALVLVPLWAPALSVTGPDHVYRTAEVTVDGDEVRLNHSRLATGPTEQVACLSPEASPSRLRGCFLESTLRHGNATVEYPYIESFRGTVQAPPPRYVVFGATGEAYRRTISYNESRSAFVVGLRPADPEAALSAASHDPAHGDPAVRRALRTGSARTDESLELGPGRLYAYEGRYRMVYEAAQPVFLSEKPGVERGFEAVAVALGGLLLFRAGRDWDR